MCKYDYACVYLCALRMRRTGIGNMSTMSPRDWEGKVDRVWLSVQIRERKKNVSSDPYLANQQRATGNAVFFSLSVKRLYLMCDVFSPRRGGMVQLIWRLKTRLWLF